MTMAVAERVLDAMQGTETQKSGKIQSQIKKDGKNETECA